MPQHKDNPVYPQRTRSAGSSKAESPGTKRDTSPQRTRSAAVGKGFPGRTRSAGVGSSHAMGSKHE